MLTNLLHAQWIIKFNISFPHLPEAGAASDDGTLYASFVLVDKYIFPVG